MRTNWKGPPKLLVFAPPHGRQPWLSKTHWIYALGRDDGVVKIGITQTPRSRVMTHRNVLRKSGVALTWYHFFTPLGREAHACERAVKRALAAVGEQIFKTEEFRGITKELAISVVRRVMAEHRGAAA